MPGSAENLSAVSNTRRVIRNNDALKDFDVHPIAITEAICQNSTGRGAPVESNPLVWFSFFSWSDTYLGWYPIQAPYCRSKKHKCECVRSAGICSNNGESVAMMGVVLRQLVYGRFVDGSTIYWWRCGTQTRQARPWAYSHRRCVRFLASRSIWREQPDLRLFAEMKTSRPSLVGIWSQISPRGYRE